MKLINAENWESEWIIAPQLNVAIFVADRNVVKRSGYPCSFLDLHALKICQIYFQMTFWLIAFIVSNQSIYEDVKKELNEALGKSIFEVRGYSGPK